MKFEASVSTVKQEKGRESPESALDAEALAEDALENLCMHPAYAFLLQNTVNKSVVEDENLSARERVAYAYKKIQERDQTLGIETGMRDARGFEGTDARPEEISLLIARIRAHAEMVGEGNKATVVMDTTEKTPGGRQLCYKFAKKKHEEQRNSFDARNSLLEESELQYLFASVAESFGDTRVAVPQPVFFVQHGDTEILAMDLLDALSIKDVLAGKGVVPEWMDLDEVFEVLTGFFEAAHERGLYHRDVNPGNILISQAPTRPKDAPLAYVIDFGSSYEQKSDEDPYTCIVNEETFTSPEDSEILLTHKRSLEEIQNAN